MTKPMEPGGFTPTPFLTLQFKYACLVEELEIAREEIAKLKEKNQRLADLLKGVKL